MKAIVLAGGFGTRLRARVSDVPKPMARVGNRPFLEYVLDRLVLGGVAEIVLSVGYEFEKILNHFGNAYRGASLHYSIERKPLGTGGAIRFALARLEDAPMLVVNGDTLFRVDYKALFDWYGSDPESLAMVLRRVPDGRRYGAARVHMGRVLGFESVGPAGPCLINAGVYIVRRDLFDNSGVGFEFSFERDFLEMWCEDLQPRAFEADGYFIDIGVPEDFDRAQRELALIESAGPA